MDKSFLTSSDSVPITTVYKKIVQARVDDAVEFLKALLISGKIVSYQDRRPDPEGPIIDIYDDPESREYFRIRPSHWERYDNSKLKRIFEDGRRRHKNGTYEDDFIWVPKTYLEILPGGEPISSSHSNAGRKHIYNWDAIWSKIVKIAVEQKELPAQADLITEIQLWYAQEFGRDTEPAPQTLKDKIQPLFAVLTGKSAKDAFKMPKRPARKKPVKRY